MDRQQRLMTEFVAGRHNLYGFIYGLIRNTHDAEDVMQEVWVRFFGAMRSGAGVRRAISFSTTGGNDGPTR